MREIVTYLSSGGKVGDILRAVRPSIPSFVVENYEKGNPNDISISYPVISAIPITRYLPPLLQL